MIKDDFKTGGFPINKIRPIICTMNNENSKVVYNRYDLKKTLKENVAHLLGIWPGYETDCYILDIEAYKDIQAPPEIHKNVDSAIEIKITMEQGDFSKVIYTLRGPNKSQTIIESQDKNLYDYIISIGLKYKTSFE